MLFKIKVTPQMQAPWLFVTIIILAIGHLSWRVYQERQAVTYQL